MRTIVTQSLSVGVKFFRSSGLSINPTEVTAPFFKITESRQQARVVQTLDSAIHRINHYPAADSSPVVSKLSLLINYLLGKRLGYARGEDGKARGGETTGRSRFQYGGRNNGGCQ